MAGHNKWSKIKRAKGVLDAKRGKIFTKILREIQVAARLLGGDPKANPRLRDALVEARKANMPKENTERAIQRGTGQEEGTQFDMMRYEAYGPEGSALLIESLTDNKNRTVADLRAILSRNHGALAETGAVAWNFERVSLVQWTPHQVTHEEELWELLMDAGLEHEEQHEDSWLLRAPADAFETMRAILEPLGLFEGTRAWVPKTTLELKGVAHQQFEKLVECLEDLDDVQQVTSNVS
jgi:YebC/PmpR family DNA-binding regulatory protein